MVKGDVDNKIKCSSLLKHNKNFAVLTMNVNIYLSSMEFY